MNTDDDHKKPTSLEDVHKALAGMNGDSEEELEVDETVEKDENADAAHEDAMEDMADENQEDHDEKTSSDDEESPVESTEEEPEYATPNARGQQAPDDVGPVTAQSLINIESMINRFVGDMDKLREQMKTQKDMLNDAVRNDAEYAQVDMKVKEIGRVKTAAKQKVMKQPAVANIVERITSLKDEMKELQDGLSQYLQQYQKIANTNQLVAENGEIREIVTTHRLVKKGKGKP